MNRAPVLAALTLEPLEPSDRPAVQRLLLGTGFFRTDEIEVALEVFDSCCAAPGVDYHGVAARHDGQLAGYAVYGPTPCTLGTWDIYWIAVDATRQRAGIGARLLRAIEQQLAGRARMIVVETSGQPLYAPTRAFYLRHGYAEVARIPDFYADGDDRVIFARRLPSL